MAVSALKDVIDNRLSTIDRTKSSNYRLSTIDAYTDKLQRQLGDQSLGRLFVAKALSRLGEAQLVDIAEYAVREADRGKFHKPGHLFVKICAKAMREKQLCQTN